MHIKFAPDYPLKDYYMYILYYLQWLPSADLAEFCGFTYRFCSKTVCENVGLLCIREHRSPCRQAPILK